VPRSSFLAPNISPNRRRAVGLLAGSILCALLALAGSFALVRAVTGAQASDRLSAHLTMTSFTSTEAGPFSGNVRVIYRFSKPSKSFSYELSRKKGKKWQTVKSVKQVKKKGSFKGSHRGRVGRFYGGNPIRVGSYRLKLSADSGAVTLFFKIVKDRSLTPVQVAAISTASQVSAGGHHTCALLSGGSIECWGGNYFGTLGNGTRTDSLIPVRVTGISTATQVSAGTVHTCAVLSGGTLKCWGNNDDGQLGNGRARYTLAPAPVAVRGITNARAISAGWGHTCALLLGGTIKCWGRNPTGELGNGTETYSSTPVQVSGISTAVQVSASDYHTCAVLSGGSVKCWGSNNSGELGNGTTVDSSTPVQVSGISTASQVSAGYEHTCALLSGGTVECWGSGQYGQLGDGRTMVGSPAPVQVSGISTATQVSAGGAHLCAVLSGGTVDCWGTDALEGDVMAVNSSTPVQVSGISTASQVSAGWFHTCSVVSAGEVKCWGFNGYGQLGMGDA